MTFPMNMGRRRNGLSLKLSVLLLKSLKESSIFAFPVLLEIASREAAIGGGGGWISLLDIARCHKVGSEEEEEGKRLMLGETDFFMGRRIDSFGSLSNLLASYQSTTTTIHYTIV